MPDQQFGNSGDEEVPPVTNTPPWIVTPASEPPPWLTSQPPGSPAWIVSEPASGRPPSPGRSRRPLVVAAAVLVVLIVAGGGGWFVTHRDKTPVAGPTAAPTTFAPAPNPTTAFPTEDTTTYPTQAPTTIETTTVADPERDALNQLDRISGQDLGEVSFDGRYVAQVASKNPGTYDKFQTTASGSHTFRATDILAEYQRLRDDFGGTKVVLLKSTDFGKHQLYHGTPLYVTFYLGRFGSADAVRSWCASTFPDLSAAARADQCAVRKMH